MASPSETARAAILGVPFDPNKKPDRVMTVRAFEQMDTKVLGVSAGAIIRDTLAGLNAVTSPPSHQMAWVLGDATAANNGVYENTGTSGSPVWTRRGDLPFSYISAINTGAGSANAIVATTALPIPTGDASALIALPIAVTNTGSPVTVAFNGGLALTIKTVSGNDVTAGGLKEGMIAAGYVSGSTFRLLNDQDVAALVAAAEEWAEGTEPGGPGTKSAREYALEAASYTGDLVPELEVTSSYTPVLEDATSKIKRLSDPAGVTLTIPANSDVAFDLGTVLTFEQVDDGQITIAGDVGVTVRVHPGVIAKSAAPGAVFQAIKMAADDWVLFGALESSQVGFLLGSQQIFTTSGTWTKPAGCRAAMVEVVGGGGGGGGTADSTTGNACAGGGGGGQYAKKWITTGLGESETVTIGAGGTGGTAGNNSGSAGGATSFGSHVTANGGAGGGGSNSSTGTLLNLGGAGGTGGSGGDIQIKGGAGGAGIVNGGIRIPVGVGGASHLSGQVGQTTNNVGTAGQAYGGGGSGAVGAGAAARAGGNGASGVVIVWEYY